MKQPIVILHGWGANMSSATYLAVKKELERKEYDVFVPDLPGFGTNTILKETLTFDDYVAFAKHYIEKIGKGKPVVLIGHSFGGRIAIRLVANHPDLVSKLILVAASGIPRPLPSIRKKIVFVVTKIVRPVFMIPPLSFFYRAFRKAVYYSIGEMDYYKAGKLSETFKNVYQVSIVADLPRIVVPTLLVWGERDTFVPVADGILMEQKIPDATLAIIKGAGHRLPYEDTAEFVKTILPFIQSN